MQCTSATLRKIRSKHKIIRRQHEQRSDDLKRKSEKLRYTCTMRYTTLEPCIDMGIWEYMFARSKSLVASSTCTTSRMRLFFFFFWKSSHFIIHVAPTKAKVCARKPRIEWKEIHINRFMHNNKVYDGISLAHCSRILFLLTLFVCLFASRWDSWRVLQKRKRGSNFIMTQSTRPN